MIDKLHERINRANAAKRILDDEVIGQIFSELGQGWVQQAIASVNDEKAALRHLQCVFVLEAIKSKLQSVVANGREATRELEKMQPTK